MGLWFKVSSYYPTKVEVDLNFLEPGLIFVLQLYRYLGRDRDSESCRSYYRVINMDWPSSKQLLWLQFFLPSIFSNHFFGAKMCTFWYLMKKKIHFFSKMIWLIFQMFCQIHIFLHKNDDGKCFLHQKWSHNNCLE